MSFSALNIIKIYGSQDYQTWGQTTSSLQNIISTLLPVDKLLFTLSKALYYRDKGELIDNANHSLHMINSMIPLHHNNHYCSVAGVVHQLLPHSSACYFLCQVFHHDCPHFFLVSPTFLWGKNRNKYHLQCAHDAITQVKLTVH